MAHFTEFKNWHKIFTDKKERAPLLRRILHNALPDEYFLIAAVQEQYGYFMDDINEGANNFAEEIMSSSSSQYKETPSWRSSLELKSILESVSDEPPLDCSLSNSQPHSESIFTTPSFHELLTLALQKTNLAESGPRAAIRGGSLPNRKAQFNSLSTKPLFSSTEFAEPPNKKVAHEPCSINRNSPLQGGISGPSANSEKSTLQSSNSPKFLTARQQLAINCQTKNDGQSCSTHALAVNTKKGLGSRGPRTAFVPPFSRQNDESACETSIPPTPASSSVTNNQSTSDFGGTDDRLRQFDAKIIELIMSEIMDSKSTITWDDIAGLHSVKETLKEAVIFPILRPDLFTGLRGPPKGLLLFGPPGTGKTLIGKCIASTSQSTFFSISASSLTSKWVGDGEKMVRALFTIARIHQPAVIFIDEIDSLLSQRSDTEHESSRRIKTEFLVQLDGVTTGAEDRLLLIGATNRPQELDEAARRRFVKRLYIPLPCLDAREEIVRRLISQQNNCLSSNELHIVAERSDGFSGSDVSNLCREAAMGPIRSLSFEKIQSIACSDVPPVTISDFYMAFDHVKPSVSTKDLEQYLAWNRQYGNFQV